MATPATHGNPIACAVPCINGFTPGVLDGLLELPAPDALPKLRAGLDSLISPLSPRVLDALALLATTAARPDQRAIGFGSVDPWTFVKSKQALPRVEDVLESHP